MKTMQNMQRGFSLITAIFLLVVLASLGAVMMTFFTVQQQSSALDVLGSRAYQASRAGIEWAAFQVVQSSVAAPPAGVGGFAALCQGATTSSSVAFAGTLAGFSVSVNCSATPHDEGIRTIAIGNPLWVYAITSTASGVNGAAAGSADYVERQMSVTIAQ